MTRNSKYLFILTALLSILCSCNRRVYDYEFIPAIDAGDEYRFTALFSDTTKAYATYIAMRYDLSFAHSDKLCLEIEVTAPNGDIRIERVDFPLTECEDVTIIKNNSTIRDFRWPYRDNIRVAGDEMVEGKWSIAIIPVDPEAAKGIIGIGFYYGER